MTASQPEKREAAVRAYAIPSYLQYEHGGLSGPTETGTRNEPFRDLGPSGWTLVFDTETTRDPGQALRIGTYQLRFHGRLRAEGFFYGPGALHENELRLVREYSELHGLAATLTRDEFANDVFLRTAWNRRGLIVGHNLPFDIARIALANGPVQSRDKSMRGGFTFKISNAEKASHVQVKRINAGGAFIRLTIPSGINPELRNRGRGGQMLNHHGYFLDTATLSGALLGGRPSLARLAELLHTDTRKGEADHGEAITPEYLDYARTDVQVTWECWQELRARCDHYELPKDAWQIYSEASIGKAHLEKIGLTPFRQLNDWPPAVFATVMQTYYGGRAECAIRRVPVPGVYVDFASQYPTVYVLQGLHRYTQAERVVHTREDPAIVQRHLDGVTVEEVLNPGFWPGLDALALVAPDGDQLPTRAKYARGSSQGNRRSTATNVAVPLRSGGPPQWYTLADCVASKLMTGKAPRVLDVLRFEPHGVQSDLASIDVAGNAAYHVDPTLHDLIRRLVEMRADARTDQQTANANGDRQLASSLDAGQQAMKATANGTAYGSPIEMNPIEHRKKVKVTVHRPDGTSYQTLVKRTERPGTWFHPLIASLVAAGGRLLLATAMHLVKNSGGQYAFCDTDSLFIVATKRSRLIMCPGGPHATDDGLPAIRTLTWDQTRAIVDRFTLLNPYDAARVPEVLKVERENYDPDTGAQREIWCYSIASKRYGLFVYEPDGRPALVASGSKLKRSEHGLGHLLPPYAKTPDLDDRRWLDEWWQHLLCLELDYPTTEPAWFDEPAVGRLTVTSTADLKAFETYNVGREHAEQVKPWNFLCLAHPTTQERARPDGPSCLIAPFERDPHLRRRMTWLDRDRPGASARRIRTDRPHEFLPECTTVLSYRTYFEQYRQHPEAKALDPTDNQTCHTWTRGLLRPHHVDVTNLCFIGKESARLADPDAATDSDDEQVIEYPSERTCRGCEVNVSGRQQWHSEACRKRAARRTIWDDLETSRRTERVASSAADRADSD